MSAKTNPGLKANFLRKKGTRTAVLTPSNREAGRGRAKGAVVSMSFRMDRSDWRRAHDLAMDEGMSVQELLFKGLSMVIKEKGLPPLNGLPSRSSDVTE